MGRDIVKRIAGIILIISLILGLSGCVNPKKLTLKKVVELSAKGYQLTWSDFEQYNSYECGSGLYILCYEIDNDYKVLIGGLSPEDRLPMYIYLVRKNDSQFIDIRKEDVEAFINGC
jgi:hypothetical protein